MNVRTVVPDEGDVDAAELAAGLVGQKGLVPFADGAMACCERLSRMLFDDLEARAHPELVALAFWLRPAEIAALHDSFKALESEDSLLVPRGLVFHVPPASVDTMFVYSWVLAFLTGNRNIVRVSMRETAASRVLLRLLSALASHADGAALRATTAMVTYGHEPEITAALSASCDMRVIWGGDATVNAVRASPVPPHCIDLAFPDRYSIALIDAGAYAALDDTAAAGLAEKFFNDTYWFDQLGCSSPRLIVWRGKRQAIEGLAPQFAARLEQAIRRRGYQLPTGAVLAKLAFASGAVMDGGVNQYRTYGNAVTTLDLVDTMAFRTDHCGGGLLMQLGVESLDELTVIIERRFQTVSTFGLPRDEIVAWARRLNGRGVDRFVPVGEALQFHRYWDGLDLLQAFTRRVHVRL
jgi:Acyl-CoA reductase (LuxC)